MKRIGFLLPLLGLLLMVSFPALADQQTYALPPVQAWYDEATAFAETYDLLVSGDTVHFLKYQYGGSYIVTEDGEHPPIYVTDGECFVINEQGEAAACPAHCGDVIDLIETNLYGSPFFGLVITPQNETYLIDANGKVLHWTPGADAPWETVTQLDMSGLRPMRLYDDFSYYSGDEDALYLLYPSAQEGCDLYAFDWTSGARRLIAHFSWADFATPAGPGKLMVSGNMKAYGYGKYYIVDCQSGEADELVSGLKAVHASNFLWNRADGWYYATNTGSIQHLGLDENEVAFSGFSGMPSDFGSCDLALSLDGQRLYILMDDARACSLSFIVLDLQETDGLTLTINGETNLLNLMFGAVSSLTGDSPELAGVQFNLRDDLAGAYDVAQSLVTRDNSYDLLIVNTAGVDLRSLFAKGYFAALDDQPEVRAYFDELYPVWRDACMWQGSIAALPFNVYDNYQFMINTELWEAYGLDVPTSYRELFSTLREMDSKGLLGEYPLFELNGRETRSFDHLLYKLLEDHMLHCDASGNGVSFDDPVLEQLLQELSELRDLLDRNDDLHLTGSPLMVFAGHATSVLGEQVYEWYGSYAPMLLAMDETRGPILQCHLSVALVNPYSKNVELAKAWLSYLAANPTEMTRCVFLTGMPDGIETEASRIEYAEYEKRSTALQRQYDEAQASGDLDAIEKAREAIYSNGMPMRDWTVTPEHAQRLYQALPYASVAHYNPFMILLDNGEQPIQEYLSGKRSAHELLQALESLAMMIDAEGQ